jgi:hypothetical protein
MKIHCSFDPKKIDEFCQRHHIRKFSFFGSVLRSDFGTDSDIDVLVEFAPGKVPGFFKIARLEAELGIIFGRKVDIRTPTELSRYFRDEVVKSSRVEYVQK